MEIQYATCKPQLPFWKEAVLYTEWLTYLPLDKMAAISQTILSDVFSWMKIFVFWLKFHQSLFLRVQLAIFIIGSDNGLVPNRCQAIIWTNAGLGWWRIYICVTRPQWDKTVDLSSQTFCLLKHQEAFSYKLNSMEIQYATCRPQLPFWKEAVLYKMWLRNPATAKPLI